MPNVTVYVMTVWQNLPSKSTALEATNLNHIEQGIKNVTDFINTLNTTAGVYLSGAPFTQELLNKLNGIEAQANKYVLPTASGDTLGGVKVDAETITIDSNGVIHGAAAAVTLESLTDVNLYDLQDGQILKYDATTKKWVNTSEAEVRTQLSLLEDVDIDDETLIDGQVLKYNATTEKWENGESGEILGYEESLEILGLPPFPIYMYRIATPIMTSNTTPSGIVSASSTSSSNKQPYYAFRQTVSSAAASEYWASNSGDGVGAWIKYEFPSSIPISKLKIKNRNTSNSLIPSQFKIQGSNDDSNWTDLETCNVASTAGGAEQTWEFDNILSYKFYRLYTTQTSNSSISFGDIQYFYKAFI